MKKAIVFAICILASSISMSGGVTSSASAQEKVDNHMKVRIENDKVLAWDAVLKPGVEIHATNPSTTRIIRALKGGTCERAYADGKKETVVWKTGEVKFLGPSQPYTIKNVGKTDVILYVVLLK